MHLTVNNRLIQDRGCLDIRYMRLKKQKGIRLFKDVVFFQRALDFLHNSLSKDVQGDGCNE